MKKTLWIPMAIALFVVPLLAPLPAVWAGGKAVGGDLATETYPEAQAQVKKRIDEIRAAAAKKDFARLASFHLYGPKFTEFKEGAPRGDATANRQGEEGELRALDDAKLDAKDLAVNVYGDTAIATFNGELSAKMQGKPVTDKQQATMVFVKYKGDWKIVHEHWSPLGPPPAPPASAAK